MAPFGAGRERRPRTGQCVARISSKEITSSIRQAPISIRDEACLQYAASYDLDSGPTRDSCNISFDQGIETVDVTRFWVAHSGENDRAAVKGPYLNDVYKFFWFFDPLPPLVYICLIFLNPPHLQTSYLASTPPPQVVPALLLTVLVGY